MPVSSSVRFLTARLDLLDVLKRQSSSIDDVKRCIAACDHINFSLNRIDGTALNCAISNNASTEIIDLLIVSGADIDFVHIVVSRGDFYEEGPCVEYFTPVYCAIKAQNIGALRLLIARGACVTENVNHKTYLQHAVVIGNLSIVQLLLESGADVHDTASSHHCLTLAGDRPDILQVLLEAGADIFSMKVRDDAPISDRTKNLIFKFGGSVPASLERPGLVRKFLHGWLKITPRK